MSKRKRLGPIELVEAYNSMSQEEKDEFRVRVGWALEVEAMLGGARELYDSLMAAAQNGFRILGGKLKRSNVEAVERITTLRGDGYSYAAIAKRLIVENIAKDNGSDWNANDVKSYCKRHNITKGGYS